MSTVSREEFTEQIRRLDDADKDLRDKIDLVASEIRSETTTAVSDLRAEQAAALIEAEGRLTRGVSAVGEAVRDVRSALTWQNRTIAGGAISGIVFFVVAYAEHFFGLGK